MVELVFEVGKSAFGVPAQNHDAGLQLRHFVGLDPTFFSIHSLNYFLIPSRKKYILGPQKKCQTMKKK